MMGMEKLSDARKLAKAGGMSVQRKVTTVKAVVTLVIWDSDTAYMSRAVSTGSSQPWPTFLVQAVPFWILRTCDRGFGDNVERESMMRRKATAKAPSEDPSKLFEVAQSYANGRSAQSGFCRVL
jgi:hypothetical protein